MDMTASSPPEAQIVLDTTLRDLYALDNTDDTTIILVYAIPTPMIDALPPSTRFAYQSPNVPTEDPDFLARIFLQVAPQSFGFIAGDMPLIFFDLAHVQDGAHRDHAHYVYSKITTGQRPQLRFVSSPNDIKVPAGTKIAIANPMDCLIPLPHTVDPHVHYDLLSKRTLALSTLPTPLSQVVDTVLIPGKAYHESVLDAEVIRMMVNIRTRACPFVVKTPQAVSGQGVFLIRSDQDRHHATDVLQQELLRSLKLMADSKTQVPTCNVILQDMVPGENVALALFITKAGRAIVSSYCPQLVGLHGQWEGGSISYNEQDTYRLKYRSIVDILARYMHERGFYGPMGVDIITDQGGNHLVIDMNIRVTGSHPLGFLKGHFSTRRGLHEAVLLFPLFLNCSREVFEHAFQGQLREGSMIIAGWCPDKEGSTSIATVILAAEDKPNLRRFVEMVKVYKVAGG
ncbi:MAG: hypothetical protein Q9169_002756 [Polycauliona sp. 2 TL-2023]